MPPMLRLSWLLALALPLLAQAGTLREKLQEHRQERIAAQLPAGSRVLREQPYGGHPRQRFDVYLPPAAQHAPILFMVHGGGWYTGDKSMSAVVENKAAHWLSKGYVLVSSNYRLIPQANPLAQAGDVAQAIATVQQQAPGWGGDPARMVLMGHSAGAHLDSLLSSDSSLAPGVAPAWLGSIALDSAAFDVPAIMNTSHYPLYDKAFGDDAGLWRAASPLWVLRSGAKPLLAVCSTRRQDSCAQAQRYATKAAGLGVTVSLLRKDLSHRDINQTLGADPLYTAEVDAFLKRLGLP